MKRQINDLEQYGRRQNLEIHGLKYTENENVLAVVNDLALSLSLEPVTESEIEGVHRLPHRKNEDKTPPVLIRFVSRKTKDQWLAKIKDLKAKQSDIRLFDNLTAFNRRLLWLARSKAKQCGYQYTWQRSGKIFVRNRTGENAICIACEDDLVNIR